MAERLETDVCVIGGGSGGLTMAAGASQMGARTVLVEKGKMGGDCLNYGCVPSKSLLAAGRAAAFLHRSAPFGVNGSRPQIDFRKVHDHVHEIIAGIAPTDSVHRFEGLGVDVIQAAARFTGAAEIEAGGRHIRAKWFVVATGSSPAVPPIPGLESLPYLTNETIFERKTIPDHLIVVGGGPIGCELAQAHRHLGAKVTILEMARILSNDDPEAADVVRQRLRRDGVEVVEGAAVLRAARAGNGVAVTVAEESGEREITGSDVLVATGRRPNIDGLDLEAAGIASSNKGIQVDRRLRSSNRRVFAVGDVAGRQQFTHIAGYHAGIVIRNALFRIPAKLDDGAVPWVTYTDPELAQVGATEAQSRENGVDINVLRFPFAENDRARAERETDGFIKVVTSSKGRILGATIVGAHAGELLLPWVLAVGEKMKIGQIAGLIAPYPTFSEVSKRVAGTFYVPKLFSARTRRLVRFLMKFA